MEKEKIQSILEQKVGHKRLFGIGLALFTVAILMFPLIHYIGNFKIILYILDAILVFIGASAILFASDIRHKNEK